MGFNRYQVKSRHVSHGQITANNRAGPNHIAARLDRFLVQSSLLDQKVITSKNLPKLTLDHKPILLQLEEEENMGPIPFRYSPLWNDKEGFKETVSSAWSTPVRGSPSFVWEQKLKATKVALKDWIKKPVKTPTTQRKESTHILENLQMEFEKKDINRTDLEEEQET